MPQHVRGQLGHRAPQMLGRRLAERGGEGVPADRPTTFGGEQHRPRQLPLVGELAADLLDPPDQQRPGIAEHWHQPLPGPRAARALAHPHVDLAQRAVLQNAGPPAEASTAPAAAAPLLRPAGPSRSGERRPATYVRSPARRARTRRTPPKRRATAAPGPGSHRCGEAGCSHRSGRRSPGRSARRSHPGIGLPGTGKTSRSPWPSPAGSPPPGAAAPGPRTGRRERARPPTPAHPPDPRTAPPL